MEEQSDLLKPAVLQYCLEHQDTEHKTDEGQIFLQVRRQWVYPAPIIIAETELKEAKKEAEAKGTATYTEKPFVVFKQDKEE